MRHRTRIKKIAGFLILLIVIGIIAGAAMFISAFQGLPSLDLLQNREVSQSTKIYDRTGEVLLYEIYGEERRTIIPFEEIPAHAKEATIAIEDAHFYEHSALDFSSLIRAQLSNLGVLISGNGLIQGGSTITQQLAKKAFLSDERTLTRKLKEAIIAYKLEQAFTKDQILELYLNQIPYGANAYGLESAAQTYFQKSAGDLSLAETALLAALPQAPSYYSPYGNHIDDLLERKNLVLQRMYEVGFITEEERAAAAEEKLVFSKLKSLQRAPHFALDVKEYLDEKYGEDFVRRSGLKVVTTLDVTLQDIAEAAVVAGAQRNTELYKGTNAALVAQDPKTGQILALVGSRNFFDTDIDGQFNVATQGLRQPGSALKPFAYLAALKAGYPANTVLFDAETEFNTTPDETKNYKPENYDHIFRGPVDLRNALAQSINVPAVKVLYLVGVDNFLNLLRSFGVNTLIDRSRFGLSLVLGGGEVYLKELVGAYSVLAQEGLRHDQHLILSITDQRGRVLEEYHDVVEPVIEPEYPRIINDMLADKDARAPLFSSSLGLTVYPGYDVALKTGTTNDYRDAWSVGYTPAIVAGVWAGNNDNTPMERRGGSILAAVPILNAFMREALPLTPAEPFAAPDPITSSKPMLSGQHIATYQSGSVLYPHIHSILQYVDKRNPLGSLPVRPDQDPQYANWEQAVLAWATANIPGFVAGSTYNQPLPPGATLVAPSITESSDGSLLIRSPLTGAVLTTNQLSIDAQIQSATEIIKIETFINGQLVDTRGGSFGTLAHHQLSLTPQNLAPQNVLRITATTIDNAQLSQDVVFYRQ